MAKYTFDTNAEQDAAIALNHALRAPEKSLEEFITASIGAELKAISDAYIEMRIRKLVDAYRIATPEQRASVDEILGISINPETDVVVSL